MLTLRDIMTREVVAVAPDATLRDTAALLVTRHISGAPVVAGGDVVGVISLTDILEFESSTPPVPMARGDEPEWSEVEDVPAGWEDESEPFGTYFSELWIDAGADVDTRFATTDSAEWDLLAEHTVSEAMTRAVLALPPGTRVDDAADYLRRHGIHRVLVMDGRRLTGIVTTMDVTAAVADHRL